MSYIFSIIIPLFILFVLIVGFRNKLDVLKLFTEGISQGLTTVLKIFPYIMAITIAISLLNETGVINYAMIPIRGILDKLNIPTAIVPLAIFRPLSGGASTSVVMDIFKNYGPDSIEGKIASVIMGGTETTFYVITVFFASVKIKKNRGTLVAALIADAVAVITAIVLVTKIKMI